MEVFEANVSSAVHFRGRGDFEAGTTISDDDSLCHNLCGQHGVCRENRCQCMRAYTGPRCNDPLSLPAGLNAAFDGSYVLNRHRLQQLPASSGYQIHYTGMPPRST